MTSEFQADAFLRETINAFSASPSSTNEQLARVDFVVRIILGLTTHSALERADFQMSLKVFPGLGALRAALKVVRDRCSSPRFVGIARAGIELLDTRLPTTDHDLSSVERLRNHLAHGGSLPNAAEASNVANVLSLAIEQTIRKIANYMGGARLVAESSRSGPARAKLLCDGKTHTLSPLLAFSPQTGALLVFARLTSTALSYIAARHEEGQRLPRADDEQRLKRIFLTSVQEDTLLSDLAQTALDDLDGFREIGTTPSSVTENGVVVVCWQHLDGGSTNSRADKLRLGPNNVWEWQDGDTWRGYSEFLRSLANWQILTQRLFLLLSELVASAKLTEDRLLPLPRGSVSPFISPSLKVGPAGAKPKQQQLDDFSESLVTDVSTNRGQTYLYFVHAEAGAGKTTALLRMALDRAEEESKAVNSGKPLFLYISARGNVLENLDQAIDATVAKTQLLNSRSVQALCRNGLIVPIIDGFDELVGSPTYADALAALRPWLKALGGRGVLVVSARSSYYLTLYEASIRKETNRDINVLHFIAVLDRWTQSDRDSYLRQYGVSSERLGLLSEDERNLLSLPFFARASVRHLAASQPLPTGRLIECLIDDYVHRERKKLQMPDGTELIQVLNELFTQLANFMILNNTREVPIKEIQDLAEIVVPGEVKPELSNRLISLCGLDVHDAANRRFKFSHEVFLDFFFGRYVADQSAKDLRWILSRCQLTPTAARVVFSKSRLSDSVLESLSDSGRSDETSPLPANLGLLWARRFATNQKVERARIHDVRFAQVDLSTLMVGELSFTGCEFGSVTMPTRTPTGSLLFHKCIIKDLQFNDRCQNVEFLACSFDTLSSDAAYLDESSSIEDHLRERGAKVTSAHPKLQGSASSSMPEMAQLFLERIKLRVAISIVLGSDDLPEGDMRLNWINRNAEEWFRFVRALLTHELAFKETVRAGGAPKQRLRLSLPPDEILNKRSQEKGVMEFWAALSRGDFDE